jgi:hypothetical protein
MDLCTRVSEDHDRGDGDGERFPSVMVECEKNERFPSVVGECVSLCDVDVEGRSRY